MWKRHWKLWRDPFVGPGLPYVPLATHEEAVARLVDTIETGQRRAVLRAWAGLGKSVVLARALAETRGPARRTVLLSSPGDGAGMLAGLAEGLGRRVPSGAGRGPCWKALDEAVRLCRWQHLGVILAVDDCQHLTDPSDRLDLERLTHLDPHPETRLTVLLASRTVEDEGPAPVAAAAAAPAPWELLIRLPPLTRSEVEAYLTAKLAAAGRDAPTFTPRAIHRLHADAAGNPRGLDRLASLALRAGALRGLEIVTPDIVEAVACECALESADLAPEARPA
jgi:type II secretory pathway predicted ATPase ExeA